RVVGAVDGDVQVGRGGIADLIAVQRIVDVEGRGLALLHVLEVGAEVHHELVRAVGRDGDVGDVDAFAGRCHQISDGTGGGDVVGRAVVRIERVRAGSGQDGAREAGLVLGHAA